MYKCMFKCALMCTKTVSCVPEQSHVYQRVYICTKKYPSLKYLPIFATTKILYQKETLCLKKYPSVTKGKF